jgi:hypothetical protein
MITLERLSNLDLGAIYFGGNGYGLSLRTSSLEAA